MAIFQHKSSIFYTIQNTTFTKTPHLLELKASMGIPLMGCEDLLLASEYVLMARMRCFYYIFLDEKHLLTAFDFKRGFYLQQIGGAFNINAINTPALLPIMPLPATLTNAGLNQPPKNTKNVF